MADATPGGPDLGAVPSLPPGFGPEVTPELVPELAHLKGPHMLGFVFSAVLFGVTFMAFIHWAHFAWFSESRGTRSLVVVTAITAVATISYTLVYELRQFVFRFGLGASNDDALWSSINFLLDALSRFPVATFFAFRTFKLYGRNKAIIPILAFVVIVPSVGSLAACATAQLASNGNSKAHEIVDKAWAISEIASNYILTIIIGFKLVKTGQYWRAIDPITTKLRVLAIETMAGPTLLSTAMIFIMTLSPYPSYMDVFTFMPLSYTVALMILLTAQFRLSAHRWTTSRGEYETHTHNGQVKSRRVAANINVTTEVYQHTERADVERDQDQIQLSVPKRLRAYGIDEEVEFEETYPNGSRNRRDGRGDVSVRL